MPFGSHVQRTYLLWLRRMAFRNRTQLFTLSHPCCFPFWTSLSPKRCQSCRHHRQWRKTRSWAASASLGGATGGTAGGRRRLVLWAPPSPVLENPHLGADEKYRLFLPQRTRSWLGRPFHCQAPALRRILQQQRIRIGKGFPKVNCSY